MNIFEKLLEIKTWKNDLKIKAIYIEKLDSKKVLSYTDYYYDELSNVFYINWLNSYKIKVRKILEEVINKSYNQELNHSDDKINSISKTKKPKVFLVYYSNNQQFIVIDKIELRVIRNKKLEILKLKVWN